MSEQAYEAPTLAGRALCDLGQQLVAMRAERDALRTALLDAQQGLAMAEEGNSDASCLCCYGSDADHAAGCCVGRALGAINALK